MTGIGDSPHARAQKICEYLFMSNATQQAAKAKDNRYYIAGIFDGVKGIYPTKRAAVAAAQKIANDREAQQWVLPVSGVCRIRVAPEADRG